MVETKRQIFDRIVTEWGELVQHREGWDDQMREEAINATSAMYDETIDDDPTCQFCHSDPFSAEWKNDEWGIEAYILGKKMCVYVRGQMDSFPIAYCPQCGRKL